jgi:hypothetical protein
LQKDTSYTNHLKNFPIFKADHSMKKNNIKLLYSNSSMVTGTAAAEQHQRATSAEATALTAIVITPLVRSC